MERLEGFALWNGSFDEFALLDSEGVEVALVLVTLLQDLVSVGELAHVMFGWRGGERDDLVGPHEAVRSWGTLGNFAWHAALAICIARDFRVDVSGHAELLVLKVVLEHLVVEVAPNFEFLLLFWVLNLETLQFLLRNALAWSALSEDWFLLAEVGTGLVDETGVVERVKALEGLQLGVIFVLEKAGRLLGVG